MAPLRKPFQGVWNVVRFNWHFYLIAGIAALGLAMFYERAPLPRPYTAGLLGFLLAPVLISLVVSAYVYDFSGLYRLAWLPTPKLERPTLLTVNAGFDEISAVLQHQFAPTSLLAVDFYDPAQHTEVSIKRARRAYPPFSGTRPVNTREALPLPDACVDVAFAFLAAHEIRDADERAAFFRELQRVTKPTGTIVVTEHLRDIANFLAYNVGFFHFHSRRTWLTTFQAAGLCVEQEISITPFITSFLLRPRATST